MEDDQGSRLGFELNGCDAYRQGDGAYMMRPVCVAHPAGPDAVLPPQRHEPSFSQTGKVRARAAVV